MKKQDSQSEAGPSERPRKQRSRTFNRHAIPSVTTLTQNSTMQRPLNESATSSARRPLQSNARRTSQLGLNQQQQQQQEQLLLQPQPRQPQAVQQQPPASQQQRPRQESSGLPRLSRIDEAIALSDARPSSSNFIKRNTSSLSPGNSEIKPKPFVVEISNIPLNTTESEIETLLQQAVSNDSFKILKLFTTKPPKVVVRVENLAVCNNIVQALNGFQWKGCTLTAQLNLEATEKTPSFSGPIRGPIEPSKPIFNRSYVPPQYRQPSLLRKNNSFYRSQGPNDSTLSSFDLRRSTTTSSRASSHASSIFSNYSHRHPSNLSTISTDLVSGKQHVPSFVTNAIQGGYQTEPTVEEEVDGNEPQQVEGQVRNTNIDDTSEEEFMEMPIGEGENPDQLIKVSPTRLFVGNVPYSSNWASLRKFLVEKANDIDPNNGISIQRVEIPVLQMSFNDGLFYGQGAMNQPQVLSRSRGFAIVTTKDRASSEKLIELLNNVEFEGRALTIRYDKFPQFNNYVLQQLHRTPVYSRSNASTFGRQYGNSESTMNNHPSSLGYQQIPPVSFMPQQAAPYITHQKFATNPTGPNLLSNLAFERNLLQQKIYYGNAPNPQPPYSANTPVLQSTQPPPITQSLNIPMPSSPNQNVLASGYYFMPYYYQAPPPPGTSMYQPYGVQVGLAPAPAPVLAPIPTHYGNSHVGTPLQRTFPPSEASGVRSDKEEQQQQQQHTSELFENLSLSDN